MKRSLIRAIRSWALLSMVGLATGSFACSEECTTNADCEANQVCNPEGVCVVRPSTRVDMARPDLSDLLDLGRMDGGNGGDGGGGDGGDGGDGGGGGDMDMGQGGGPREGVGRLDLYELRPAGSSNPSSEIDGAFIDATGAGRSTTTTPVSDIDVGSCELTTVQVAGPGTLGAFDWTAVEVELDPDPNMQRLRFVPDGRGSLQPDPAGSLPASLFALTPGQTAAFDLFGDASSNLGLGDLMGVQLSVPPVFSALTPATAVRLDPTAGILFQWGSQSGPVQNVVLELYDEDRSVVLRCTAPLNSTSYTLPPKAGNDFFAAGPTGALTLDLGFESRSTRMVVATAGGMVPVTFRILRGARYADVGR